VVGDVVLLDVVFADHSGSKLRPAVVIDVGDEAMMLVPLRTVRPGLRTTNYQLQDWAIASLSRPTATMPAIKASVGDVLALVGSVSGRDWRGVVGNVTAGFGQRVEVRTAAGTWNGPSFKAIESL
jgi:hypothetical protein